VTKIQGSKNCILVLLWFNDVKCCGIYFEGDNTLYRPFSVALSYVRVVLLFYVRI